MKVHRFVVKGIAAFPFDMLRYDQCWPAGSEDVNKLFNDLFAKREMRELTLCSHYAPTPARWSSFLWHVVSIDGVKR